MNRDRMAPESNGQDSSAPRPPVEPPVERDVERNGRVPAGRRISFVAWGLAGVAGLAIWALIFKLV
jgi:hypothetical protein